MSENPIIIEADFERSDHREAVLELLKTYTVDPMGGNCASSTGVGCYVLPHLRDDPKVITLLAYVEFKAIGIAICFRGFSTEADHPLLILSDFFVLPEHRGRGIGRRFLEFIDDLAHRLDCPRLLLKVKADNDRAMRLYEASGYIRAALAEKIPGVVCLEKILA